MIENQLEKSYHNHLGKLITYRKWLEAKVAIWIVSKPRPEHVWTVSSTARLASRGSCVVTLRSLLIARLLTVALMLTVSGSASEVIGLNGTWRYAYDLADEAASPDFVDSKLESVHIPHNLRDFSQEQVRSGRTLWFWRSFLAPELSSEQRAVLEVSNAPEPEVWINGKRAGAGPKDSFFLDAEV